MKKSPFLFLMTLVLLHLGEGQDKRLRRDDLSVRVHVAVVKLDSGYFRYSYLFENSVSSHQSMDGAIIDLNDEWSEYGGSLRNPVAPAEKNWGRFPTVGKKMRWVPSYDTTGLDALEWVPLSALRPGEHLSFSFEAKGLPGIGNFWAAGWAPWYFNEQQRDSLLLEGYPEGDLRLKDENFLKGLTVVRGTLPISFLPTQFLDTLNSYASHCRSLGWITTQAAVDKYVGYFAATKSQLQVGNFAGARSTLQTVLHDVDLDSSLALSSEAYALIRYNIEYLLAQLPAAPPPGLVVKLIKSAGTKLTGGSLQYYDGSWKDATNNNDGTFSITTSLKTLSLRMTYEFATQTKSNVTVGYDTVAFQTVKAQIKLQNSQGAPIDTGTVQYYFSSWKALGSTTNGVASKELLPGNYTFRMTYASATNDKQQDIGANPAVVFQTMNASVQLKNSLGALIDQGTVQYYFSSWKSFGVTTGGVATKELLPGNYTFRMTFAAATNDKQQNIGTNATVVFQTVNAAVQLKNSQGGFIDQGTVQYYFSSWNNFGTTTTGVATKELLPRNYTFRMTYESATNDKQQNIGTNPTVLFQTVNAIVQLLNSQGAPMDTGRVQYYFSSWKDFGTTSNGVAAKELLPANYTFRMTHESVTNDKAQNISTSNTVSFSTVLCTVSVKNSQSQPVDNAQISYYFSTWRQIGPTVNGQVTKELLPANLTLRMTLGTVSQNKAQNIGPSSLVEFITQ